MDPLRNPDSIRARKARPAKSSAALAPKGDVTRLKGMVEPAPRGGSGIDLKRLRTRLSVAVSVVNVCVATLEAQSAHRDLDAAEALQRCVSDPLWEQIEQLDHLIARGAS